MGGGTSPVLPRSKRPTARPGGHPNVQRTVTDVQRAKVDGSGPPCHNNHLSKVSPLTMNDSACGDTSNHAQFSVNGERAALPRLPNEIELQSVQPAEPT